MAVNRVDFKQKIVRIWYFFAMSIVHEKIVPVPFDPACLERKGSTLLVVAASFDMMVNDWRL